jgi:antirestriction protein ArdC
MSVAPKKATTKKATAQAGPTITAALPRQERKAAIYQAITDRIINELRGGRIPWKRPWKRLVNGEREYPANYATYLRQATGQPATTPTPYYSGINAMILCCFHHSRPYYLTFKQAQALGGQVKKGSKGIGLIYFEMQTYPAQKAGTEQEGSTRDETTPLAAFPMLKPFYVFHISDIDGINFELPELAQIPHQPGHQQLAVGERIYEQMPNRPAIDHETYISKAAYRERTDTVFMPRLASFNTPTDYYATLFHELVHYAARMIMPHRIDIRKSKASFRCGHAA